MLMGIVKKINDEFYIEFNARGLLYQKKAGSNRVKAEALLKETERKIAKGEMGVIVRDIEYKIFFQSFLEYALRSHTPITFSRFSHVLDEFSRFLDSDCSAVIKLSHITPSIFEQWRAKFIVTNKYPQGEKLARRYNIYLLLMREVFEHARALGWINDNPTLHTHFIEHKNYFKIKMLTGDDKRKVLALSSDRLDDQVLKVLILTGLQVTEFRVLRWDQIDLEQSQIVIDYENFKRVIPMGRTVKDIFYNAYASKKNDNIFPESLNENLLCKRLEDCLGCDEVGLISLRHTFISRILGSSISLSKLYLLAGFQDIARLYSFLDLKKNKLMAIRSYTGF